MNFDSTFWVALVVILLMGASSIFLIRILLRRNADLSDQLEQAIQSGLELSRNAIANDAALRQGLDDQQELYENEMIADKEKIVALQRDLTYSRENMSRLLKRISDLETAHAMHTDHCLPVLAEMREVAGSIDPIPPTEAEKYLASMEAQKMMEETNADAANAAGGN